MLLTSQTGKKSTEQQNWLHNQTLKARSDLKVCAPFIQLLQDVLQVSFCLLFIQTMHVHIKQVQKCKSHCGQKWYKTKKEEVLIIHFIQLLICEVFTVRCTDAWNKDCENIRYPSSITRLCHKYLITMFRQYYWNVVSADISQRKQP